MLKFINKIIDKIQAWIEKQERYAIEDSIYGLCSSITDNYRDIKLKCYYDEYSPDTFIMHINEIYVHNTGFREYLKGQIDYFTSLFPGTFIIYNHFNPVDSAYFDKKKHVLIYKYGTE